MTSGKNEDMKDSIIFIVAVFLTVFSCNHVLLVLLLTAGLSINNLSQAIKSNSLENLISVSYARTENEDDEKNKDVSEKCSDGTWCECIACVTGQTDCSPTCPCCD